MTEEEIARIASFTEQATLAVKDQSTPQIRKTNAELKKLRSAFAEEPED